MRIGATCAPTAAARLRMLLSTVLVRTNRVMPAASFSAQSTGASGPARSQNGFTSTQSVAVLVRPPGRDGIADWSLALGSLYRLCLRKVFMKDRLPSLSRVWKFNRKAS